MSSVLAPYAPIAGDLPLVGTRLQDIGRDQHPLLGDALQYVFQTHGKQIRPALVLLSGKLGRYDVDRLVTLAASLEVVHTASLVHDDTIDEALSRRGLATVSAVWDSKIAILLGDFLFGQSAFLAAQLDSVRIMRLLSDMVMELTGGELLQYAAARDRVVDESDYVRRIGGKTASLLRMCCEGGAVASGQSEREISALRSYGYNLGLAFQIADDVLDVVGSEDVLGKPAGSDFRGGVMTLPIILFAGSVDPDSPLASLIRSGDDPDAVIAAVRGSDAPARSLQYAREYAERARKSLAIYPRGEARDALSDLTREVVERTS